MQDSSAPALRATVATDRAALEAHADAWDELADACSRPFCAHGWLTGWWDHARPAGATPAVVLVHAGAELVGVAPGFCDRGPAGVVRWRPLGAGACQRVEPFAAAGHQQAVAEAVAAALCSSRPRPQLLSFEGVEAGSPWPALLAGSWPARRPPRTFRLGTTTALVVNLADGDFDAWLAGKSQHFRQRLNRARRRVQEAGGAFRLADASTAATDVEAFLRLHAGRWAARGGTRAVPAPVAAFLRAAAPRLVASGHLRLWSLEVDGRTVGSSMVLRAGDEVGYWLNGFDEAWSRLEPSKVAILHVVEDAFGLGAVRLDLGEGDFAYKRRFTSEDEDLVRLVVVPRSRRAPQVALALAPALLRTFAAEHLPPERRARLRALRDRVGGRT